MSSKAKILNFLNKFPLLKKIILFFRPPSLKFDLYGSKNRRLFSKLIIENNIDGKILDVGSGPIEYGNTKGLSKEILKRRVALDYIKYPGVDIVASVNNIPLDDNSVAGVIFQGVIEHISDPGQALNEIARILKPNGYIYIEAPFIQHFHYDPEDNYRYTEDGLGMILFQKNFEVIKKGSLYGPSAALIDSLIEYIAISFRHILLYYIIKWILTWLLFWIKYLDIFFINNKLSKLLSLAVYAIGKKNV